MWNYTKKSRVWLRNCAGNLNSEIGFARKRVKGQYVPMLTTLYSLNLSRNQIQFLPLSIGNLNQLTLLDLQEEGLMGLVL
jgi:Leucine-rich repeat (LRR) protein